MKNYDTNFKETTYIDTTEHISFGVVLYMSVTIGAFGKQVYQRQK